MRTISLRYTDKFAPQNGTIRAHQTILDEKGYVWYGKMGARISEKVAEMILKNANPRFLLIHSGCAERYWMYIDDISREKPDDDDFPMYYREISDRFKTWFRVIKIELANKDVIGKCRVISSGASLSESSRHSMSPYFIIDFEETGEINI